MFEFMRTLLLCTLTSTALATVYFALQKPLLKRYKPKWLYIGWLVIMLLFALPFRPQIQLVLPYEYVAELPMAQFIPEHGTQAVNQEITANTAYQAPQAIMQMQWWQIVFVLWIVGLATFCIVSIARHIAFLRMVKRWSIPAANENIIKLFKEISRELDVKKSIELKICSTVKSPMLVGFIKPRILLPSEEAEGLGYILHHELVHYTRKDLWTRLLILAAVAINWFNPAVYIASKTAMLQCELACDSEVVKHKDSSERHSYTDTILAAACNGATQGALTTNFYGGKNGMKARILAILDKKRKKAGATIICVILVFTMGSSVVLAAEAPPEEGEYTPLPKIVQSYIAPERYEQSIAKAEPTARATDAAISTLPPVSYQYTADDTNLQFAAKALPLPSTQPVQQPQLVPTAQPAAPPTVPQPKPTDASSNTSKNSYQRDPIRETLLKGLVKFGLSYKFSPKTGYIQYYKGRKVKSLEGSTFNYRGKMYTFRNEKYFNELSKGNDSFSDSIDFMMGYAIFYSEGVAVDETWRDVYLVRGKDQKVKSVNIVKSVADDGRINPPPGYKPT